MTKDRDKIWQEEGEPNVQQVGMGTKDGKDGNQLDENQDNKRRIDLKIQVHAETLGQERTYIIN